MLGNKDRLLAASSPTGPAFEGAQISAGQRAAPGAIERLRIDPETLEPRYSVIGSDIWSDEAGFDDAVANSGITGICGSGIIEALGEMYLSGIITAEGVTCTAFVILCFKPIKYTKIQRLWQAIPNSKISCTAKVRRTKNAPKSLAV